MDQAMIQMIELIVNLKVLNIYYNYILYVQEGREKLEIIKAWN